jgi:hypothetical protein
MRKHKARGKTPAMAADLTDKPMLMADLVELLDRREQVAIYDRCQGTTILGKLRHHPKFALE